MKYSLTTLKRLYNRFSKAEKYLLMFEYEGLVYGKFYKRIPSRFLYVRNCKRQNDLYIRFNNTATKKSMLKGSIVMGTASDLLSVKYNAGVMAEKLAYSFYRQKWHGKDNIPFYMAGDITIDGQQVQIKYEHARMAYGATLKKLNTISLKEGV